MDYEFLDDFFVSPDEGQPEFVVSFKLSNSTFLSCLQIQEDDDDLEEIYESHPMMLMIKYKRTDLLGHPLCRALVRYKWTTVIDTLLFAELIPITFYYSLDNLFSISMSFTIVCLSDCLLPLCYTAQNHTTHWSYPICQTTQSILENHSKKIYANIFHPQYHDTRPDTEWDNQLHESIGL